MDEVTAREALVKLLFAYSQDGPIAFAKLLIDLSKNPHLQLLAAEEASDPVRHLAAAINASVESEDASGEKASWVAIAKMIEKDFPDAAAKVDPGELAKKASFLRPDNPKWNRDQQGLSRKERAYRQQAIDALLLITRSAIARVSVDEKDELGGS